MDRQASVTAKLREIEDHMMTTDTLNRTRTTPGDIYYIFVFPLALLLLWEMTAITLKRRAFA